MGECALRLVLHLPAQAVYLPRELADRVGFDHCLIQVQQQRQEAVAHALMRHLQRSLGHHKAQEQGTGLALPCAGLCSMLMAILRSLASR